MAMFDLQRTAIRQTQQLFHQGMALQRAANRMALNGLKGQEMLGRQGTEMAQVATHTALQSMGTMLGGDGQRDQLQALDEQFEQFKRMHAQFFEVLERELQRSVDSFDELSEEYVETVDEQTEETIEVIETIEDQTAEDVDRFQEQFGEQLRGQIALTQEVQSQFGDQVERGADQAAQLLHRQAEQTEQFQQQLEADAEMIEVPIEEPSTTGGETERQLEDLDGIGSTYAERLRDGGIETPGDLADADVETVTEAVDVSEDQAEEWIRQANR